MKFKSNLFPALSVAMILSLAPASFAQEMPSGAYQWQMQGIAARQQQAQMERNLAAAESRLKVYMDNHDHFPSNVSEFDECLSQIAGSTNNSSEIATNGKYRTLGLYAIAVDSSLAGIPVVNGKPIVPNHISGPANTIVLLSDGDRNCVGWIAGTDGRPVTNGDAPIYFEQSYENR